ncbi:MAG TPA: hypothetical protein VF406_07795 [Thermodesulfobacteriota bacterium]
MKTPRIPTAEDVLPTIDPLLRAIYAALEAGTQSARDFFDSLGQPIDPSLAPALVRYHAKLYLDSAGHQVSVVEFEREPLANNGLCLHTPAHSIRILKAALNGRPPVPGPSRARIAFYNQQPYLFPFMEEELARAPLNLLVLWDVTPAYALRSLSLVCPKSGDTTRESVDWHWRVALDHPALAVPVSDAGTSPDDDLDMRLDVPQDDAGSEPGA